MKKSISKYRFLSVLTLLILLNFTSVKASDLLTDSQNLWLSKNNNTIFVLPEKNYPPFVSGSNGAVVGLGVDYIESIGKELDIKIKYLKSDNLSNILDEIKNTKQGVIVALSKNVERQEYLTFTKPFIKVPAVIVVRKDADTVSLSDLSGKAVAIGKDYAVEAYISENYPKIIIEPVSDDEVALQRLLLG